MRPFPRLPAYLAIAGLAFAASATGLGNGYALDDIAIITGNARVHTLAGWWRLFETSYWPAQYGASLYRPIPMLGYAIQWWIGGGAPWVFHVVSVAMYVAVCVLAFALFRATLPPFPAVIAGSLFAVHPVHVEAVANVVGQAELIAALSMLGACVVYLRSRRAGALTRANIAVLAALFGIACLAKEHALLLPFVLGLIEVFAVTAEPSTRSPIDRLRALFPLGVVVALVGLAYLAARTWTLGDLLGERSVVPVPGFGRVLVMLAVAPHWVRLFYWPAHLSADYSPRQIEIPTGFDVATLFGLVVVVGALTLYLALGRRRGVADDDRRIGRLALGWMAVTLLPVSNLLSVFMIGERTLLVPSVGAMLLAGVGASVVWRHRPLGVGIERGLIAVAVSVLGVLGLVRSRDRQRVWRDEQTLFAQTVLDAPKSYRAQFFYGQKLFESGRRAEGERHLRLAIALNPTPSDVSPLNYLATQYRDAGMCAAALPLYERAIANDSQRPDVRFGLAACLLNAGNVADGKRLAQDGVRRGDLKGLFEGLIARADSMESANR